MITIDKVKELRQLTDAPINDCKKALEISGGNIDEAREELKKLGKANVRTVIPNAGAIGIFMGDNHIYFAVGKCETDFVARNDKFIEAVDKAAMMCSHGGLCEDIKEEFLNIISVFKENCKIDLTLCDASAGNKIAYYLHHNRQRLAYVEYSGDNSEAAVKVATHIAAMNPKYINEDQVPASIIAELKQSLTQKLKDEGKPEKSIEMIVKGQLKKKLSENVLYEQGLYSDPKINVGQYCKDNCLEIVKFENIVV